MSLLTPEQTAEKIIKAIKKFHKNKKETSRFFLSCETFKELSERETLRTSFINAVQHALLESEKTEWLLAWRTIDDQYQGFLLYRDSFIDTWDELL